MRFIFLDYSYGRFKFCQNVEIIPWFIVGPERARDGLSALERARAPRAEFVIACLPLEIVSDFDETGAV